MKKESMTTNKPDFESLSIWNKIYWFLLAAFLTAISILTIPFVLVGKWTYEGIKTLKNKIKQ